LPRAGANPGCPLQLPLHLTLSLAVLSRTTPQAHACWRNPPFRRNGLRPSPFLAGLSSRRPGRYRTRHRCASYLEPCTVSPQLETPGPILAVLFHSCALRALELSRDHLLCSSCSKRPPSPPRIVAPAERSNTRNPEHNHKPPLPPQFIFGRTGTFWRKEWRSCSNRRHVSTSAGPK